MAAVTTTTPANYYHSPASSNNNSPTSHHQLPLQSRQLRPPKAPLYVPAALRPTERPPKQHNQHHQASPPTPPRSIHASSSLDSLNDSPTTPDTYEPITRRSTMESSHSGSVSAVVSKLAEDEWMKNESLGYVTGLPTKDHWKADKASPNCDSPTCRSSFGLFLRRHHCRHCGHVFCSSHTPHLVPLDQNARFHPDGVPSRACDLCWHAYNRWEENRDQRLNKIQSVLDAQHALPTDLSHDSDASDASDDGPKSSLTPPVVQSGDIAASVPRGWNWSTF